MLAQIALVVDDDEFFRMALHTILTGQLGCSKVIEAACFDEALERLSGQADISFALFDLSMPGIRTPANLKVIRETFPSVRVVVVSASNSRRDVLMALEAGVHGYVPKNLGIAEVTAALKAVFEGAVYVPSFLSEIPPNTEEANVASSEAGAAVPEAALRELTPRQQDVLHLIVRGESNKAIARALNLGEGTVKVHVAALFRNLGVNSRAAAAAAGARLISGAEKAPKVCPLSAATDRAGANPRDSTLMRGGLHGRYVAHCAILSLIQFIRCGQSILRTVAPSAKLASPHLLDSLRERSGHAHHRQHRGGIHPRGPLVALA